MKNLKSLKEFKKNLNRTYKLINGLVGNVIATETWLKIRIADKKLDNKSRKIVNSLKVDKKDRSYLFEIGYIALFSNFEFFMFDLLKELFLKFPKSLPADKLIKFDEISEFSSVKKIKEYIADSSAIEKSYDPKDWSEFLLNKYNIKAFKNKNDLTKLELLNGLRNAFMHSGGKVNSKFRNKFKKMLKSDIPLNDRITMDREKYFNILYHYLKYHLGNF